MKKIMLCLSSDDTTFYVDGLSRKYGPGRVKMEMNKKGWIQRPLSGSIDFMNCLRVDYISQEDPRELEKWLRIDFKTFTITSNDKKEIL
jgi:hypothetical protein